MRLAVHSHYGDELAYSMAVGVTHWEALGAAGAICLDLRRPSFAPNRLAKRSKGLGPHRAARESSRCLAPVLSVGRRLARCH